jgi:hypothetical protein
LNSGAVASNDHVLVGNGGELNVRFTLDPPGNSSNRSRLTFRVHSMADEGVSVMQGRVRIALADWDPFPSMDVV